jgi:hypothetical protein
MLAKFDQMRGGPLEIVIGFGFGWETALARSIRPTTFWLTHELTACGAIRSPYAPRVTGITGETSSSLQNRDILSPAHVSDPIMNEAEEIVTNGPG